MEYRVLQVDAFTTEKGQGNPAGVVLEGDQYSEKVMQAIAKKVGFNETVFVCASQVGAIRLRYFTPGHETPLCGHATVGAVFALCREQGSRNLQIETGAGLLSIKYDDAEKRITMEQAEPQFISFKGDRKALCSSLGIKETDIHPDLPIEYGNTGSWTLLVPLQDKRILDFMVPQTQKFPNILKENPQSSVHPFAVISRTEGILSARHFSSPYSGTTEDSVTGTASGVMGAYLMNHLYQDEKKQFVVQQGKHVQREGIVLVEVKRGQENKHKVAILGQACLNKAFSVTIDAF